MSTRRVYIFDPKLGKCVDFVKPKKPISPEAITQHLDSHVNFGCHRWV